MESEDENSSLDMKYGNGIHCNTTISRSTMLQYCNTLETNRQLTNDNEVIYENTTRRCLRIS